MKVVEKLSKLHQHGYVHGDLEARHVRHKLSGDSAYGEGMNDNDILLIDFDQSVLVGQGSPEIWEEQRRVAAELNISMDAWKRV